MSKTFVRIFAATLFAVVLCVATADGETKSCHVKGFNFKEGEKVTAPKDLVDCGELLCRNAENNDYSIMECGLMQLPEGCNVDTARPDYTLPYPACCEPRCGTKSCRVKGLYLKEGERVTAPKDLANCGELICLNAEKNDYSIMGCGLIKLPEGCNVHTSHPDLTLPYPACCEPRC